MIFSENEPDYIVVRGPVPIDGLWHDKNSFATQSSLVPSIYSLTFVPTGRFEVRDDGAVAEVWEVVKETETFESTDR